MRGEVVEGTMRGGPARPVGFGVLAVGALAALLISLPVLAADATAKQPSTANKSASKSPARSIKPRRRVRPAAGQSSARPVPVPEASDTSVANSPVSR